MEKEYQEVSYSYEHGDMSLPHLKDLVSETEDPEKGRILSYLKLHRIAVCPGIIRDEINPAETIGTGELYADGTYCWDDAFTNYVDRYNIPVPEKFREHILQNHTDRKERHALFSLVDSIEIRNNPYLGFIYDIRIHKNGVVRYRNSSDCKDGAVTYIKPSDAEYIIDPVTEELFCYDSDQHGNPINDGYHWKAIFYINDEVIHETEGWPGEDEWRYGMVRDILKFAERYIPMNLGSEYMNHYRSEDE